MSDARLAAFRQAGDDLTRFDLVSPGLGNLSIWTPEGVIITAEGARLHRLEPHDLVLIARSTEPPVSTPSMDTPIHRAIYVSATAKAVVFARPLHAIALTFGQHSFEPPDLDGAHLLGSVPVVSPRRSVVDLVAQAMAGSRVVIVEGHGCYARAGSLDDAVQLCAVLEASAQIAWLRGERPSPPAPLPPQRARGA